MFANSTPSSPYGIEILPVPLDVDNLAFVILLLFYIKIIMPVGLTLAVDFVVIVTINCFLSQENENILFEKVLFNENAIFFSDL